MYHAFNVYLRAVVRSFTHSFTHSLAHSLILIDSFIHPFIHPFIRPFILPFILPFIRPFIRPFIYSFIHSFVHSLIHSLLCQFIHFIWREPFRCFVGIRICGKYDIVHVRLQLTKIFRAEFHASRIPPSTWNRMSLSKSWPFAFFNLLDILTHQWISLTWWRYSFSLSFSHFLLALPEYRAVLGENSCRAHWKQWGLGWSEGLEFKNINSPHKTLKVYDGEQWLHSDWP